MNIKVEVYLGLEAFLSKSLNCVQGDDGRHYSALEKSKRC